MALTIASTREEHGSSGDFGAEIHDDQLLVAQDVAAVLERLSVRTATQFVAYLHTFPSSLAEALGWSVEDVVSARRNLIEKLHGFVPEIVLDPPQPARRGYGAMRPPAVARSNGRG